jgi:hypothetical protein
MIKTDTSPYRRKKRKRRHYHRFRPDADKLSTTTTGVISEVAAESEPSIIVPYVPPASCMRDCLALDRTNRPQASESFGRSCDLNCVCLCIGFKHLWPAMHLIAEPYVLPAFLITEVVVRDNGYTLAVVEALLHTRFGPFGISLLTPLFV